MGIDIGNDFELQNYLRTITGMPTLNKDAFDAE
jgi:hypothetical protein